MQASCNMMFILHEEKSSDIPQVMWTLSGDSTPFSLNQTIHSSVPLQATIISDVAISIKIIAWLVWQKVR